jgi:predicted nuclease of predicted toxin-antitoxin system
VKFYLDADLSPRIAELLRRQGFDAVSAHEVGKPRIPDKEQLALAAQQDRCLVTRNSRDFLDLSREAVSGKVPHAGIIICPPSLQGSEFRIIAEALIRVAERYPGGLGGYDIIYLD